MSETRWTSTFDMFIQHVELRIRVSEILDDKLEHFLLRKSAECRMDALLKLLLELRVVVKLKRNDCKLQEKMLYLDSVLMSCNDSETKFIVYALIT